MLIRITPTILLNTETNTTIEYGAPITENHPDDHDGYLDIRAPYGLDGARDFVRLHGTTARGAWEKLCEVAEAQAAAVFNQSFYLPK